MALVDYPDSESITSDGEESSLPQSSRKRKHDEQDERPSKCTRPTAIHSSPIDRAPSSTLPSLPSTFHSLYASTVRTSTTDDPILHSGRTRQTPHIHGSWPTHIYLEWYPSPIELHHLTHISHLINQPATHPNPESHPPKIHTLLQSDLGAQLPLHISLSAPLVLPTDQRSSFHDALETAIARSNIKAFAVTTGSLDWVSNSDRSRWFLVLRVDEADGKEDSLDRLLRVCNDVVKGFELPQLYHGHDEGEEEEKEEEEEEGEAIGGGSTSRVKHRHNSGSAREMEGKGRSGCFHVSIAWTLQDPGAGREELQGVDERHTDIHFGVVKLKVGNVVHDIPLAPSGVGGPAA